jgi:alpha-beta hydrolase superfamily lysophospholipase
LRLALSQRTESRYDEMIPLMQQIHATPGTFPSKDGTHIGYFKLGSGPGVVIVHHSLATGASWHRVAEHLASDFTCYVLNRRGRASSGDAPDYSIAREYEDIQCALALAGEGASLVAHSFGAVCALGAALLAAPRKLVLYEPPLPVGGTVAGPYLPDYRAAIAAGDPGKALEIGYTHFASVPPDKVALMRATSDWKEALPLAHTWSREVEAVEAHGPSLERYRALTMPTLLLLGTLSAPHPLKDTTAGLAATLPNARVVDLQGQGHLANARAPGMLADIIRDFLV